MNDAPPSPLPAEPKALYRRLARLVESFDPARPLKSLLDNFVEELLQTLSPSLALDAVLLYGERVDGYELMNTAGTLGHPAAAEIARTEPWLERLQEARFALDAEPAERAAADGSLPQAPVAAFLAGYPSKQLLVLFVLGRGWAREDVELELNTVRVALGSRLISERVRTTFAEAVEIQRSLLLARAPAFPGYDIGFRMHAAEEVGGDLYDFIEFDADILGVAVGDASGHGLPAALLVHDVVTGMRMGLEKDLKFSHVFRKLNRVIHRSRMTSRFVSVFYGELEPNGNLLYVNAGHEPPLLFLGDEVHELRAGGTVLGPLADVRFKRGFAHLDRGATLVMLTDGLLERRDERDRHFGRERVIELVRAHRSAPAAELVERLFDDAYAFGGGRRWEDDATAVVIKRAA